LLSKVTLFAQRTVNASSYPGADLGAKLIAADAALGSGPGTILVNAPGDVTTPVELHSGHGLALHAATHWVANITLDGGNTVACSGQNATMSVELAKGGALFLAENVRQLAVDGCWVRELSPGANQYFLLEARHVTQVKVSHCHTTDIGVLHGLSAARNFAESSEENNSHDFEFSDNFVDSSPAFPDKTRNTGVLLIGITGATITHNVFHGLTHGVQYWGGDSNHDLHGRGSPRWARNIVIADNQCSDVQGSCYWGSMGQNVQYLRNKAQHCGDACLDIEGDANDVIDGNTVIDGNLGILMRNEHLEYKNNIVITTNGPEPLVHISNNIPSPHDNYDIYMHDNTFDCKNPPGKFCNIEYQDVGNFVFQHNMVTNGLMHPYETHQGGTTIADNTFVYDHVSPERIFAIDASWQVDGATARVVNNTVLNNVPQLPGSQCIHLEWADTGAPAQYFIQGNTCGGRYPLQVDLQMVSSGARTSGVTFHVQGNHFSQNQIVRTDRTRTAQFDVRQ
jgi:hypothetical protein